MLMSNRIKEIIEVILNSKGYVTVGEIARQIEVSDRTVYREIPEVTEVMREYGVQLNTASKKGMVAVGSAEDMRNLRISLGMKKQIYIVDPKERVDFILLYLLHEYDYIKTEALAIDNHTSIPTVRNDLKKVKEQLSGYDLHLIQKKGEGILITGSEIEKNSLMVHTLLNHADESSLYQWLNSQGDLSNPFVKRMEEYGYRHVMSVCHRNIKNIIQDQYELSTMIKDREYLEYILLIAMMISCHQKGRPYEKEFETENFNKEEQKITQRVKKSLEKEFDILLSEQEEQYISWVLHVGMVQDTSRIYTIQNHKLDTKIYNFIQYVEDRMGIQLIRDKELKESLYIHIDRALSRIRSGMCISNPLIEDVKRDYEELFIIIREGVNKIFEEDFFPDDEIGYLVLYFAVSLDNVMKRSFRILVVCSGGMGSSKMLSHRLEQEIPEICVRKEVSLIGFGQENLDEYDLILSTIPLYIDKRNYLKVSPLLSRNELEQIHEAIKRHKYKTMRKITVREKERRQLETQDNIESLEKLRVLMDAGLRVIKRFKVIRAKEKSLKNNLLRVLSEESGRMAKEFDAGNRKQQYYLMPAAEMVYYEAVFSQMSEPRLFAVHFEDEQYMSGGEKYTDVIYAVYPENPSEYEKNILNHVLESVIADKDIQDMIHRADERGIKQWIAYRFKQYLSELLSI
ncbi:BglG family transcription antiterminator [Anaerostipes sp.]|uniref:BglG family transcription antiterminator n=1 Tax=Anaerostipes sp. TaxID=1872530 RepID=UPI0025B8FE02|nr:transcription antiterminator [Anaerostipes sp.]MBS7008121.1 transcription antiterminator [Anaerostipes sp.]